MEGTVAGCKYTVNSELRGNVFLIAIVVGPDSTAEILTFLLHIREVGLQCIRFFEKCPNYILNTQFNDKLFYTYLYGSFVIFLNTAKSHTSFL